MIGSRSANRGGCAQPCRLPFSVNGSGSADLSLKDLCALEMLPALVACGVASFKIEGRMKRPEYVGAAVRAVYEKLHSGAPDVGTLRSVFSRGGFTNGYLENKRGREMFEMCIRDRLVTEQGAPVAAARIFPDEAGYHVGRICVRKDRRGEGLGRLLLAEAERFCRELGGKRLALGAQLRAAGFYEACGFRRVGEAFLDEYCPHILMVKDL